MSIQTNNEGRVLFNPIDKKETLKIKQKKLPIVIFGPSLSDNNNLSFNKYNFFIKTDNDDKEDINKLYSILELGFSE